MRIAEAGGGSVAGREAALDEARLFDLVDDRDGQVLIGDVAATARVDEQLIAAYPEARRALARVNLRGRANAGPAPVRAAKNPERFAMTLQETMPRAWRGFDAFEARASTKNWLFKIATNTSLNIIEARSRRNRVWPERLGGPASDRPTGKPDVEVPWIEPYPDGEIESIADPGPGPDARYELREAVRFAFVAAIQELPPRQRAALLLADVMDWSAIEVAAVLDTSVASVNSALQRARATLAAPQREAGKAATVDEQDGDLLQRYVAAWESKDLEKFVALLKDDATYAMPPWREWYSGRASISDFFASVWSPYRGFRLVPTGANLQPAFGLYALGADGRWNAHSLQLLSIDQGEIATFTAFVQPLANKLFPAFQLPPVLEA